MTRRAVPGARWSMQLLLLLLFVPSGCTTWHTVAVDTALPGVARLGSVRVTRIDDSTVRLARSRLSADTLHGRRANLVSTESMAVPTDSIRTLERRRIDVARTAGVALLWSALTTAYFILGPYS